MTSKFASLLAAIAISAASIAPAVADTGTRNNSVAVAYADLDLTRVEGVQRLSLRIRKAIDKVCGRPQDSASMTRARQIRACRADAMETAVATIDAPLLTALHQSGQTRQFAGL